MLSFTIATSSRDAAPCRNRADGLVLRAFQTWQSSLVPEVFAMRMRQVVTAITVPPLDAGHPPTTAGGDGHGSTMSSSDLTRSGGMYSGAAYHVLEMRSTGSIRTWGSQYGGAGYGTGAYGPPR